MTVKSTDFHQFVVKSVFNEKKREASLLYITEKV